MEGNMRQFVKLVYHYCAMMQVIPALDYVVGNSNVSGPLLFMVAEEDGWQTNRQVDMGHGGVEPVRARTHTRARTFHLKNIKRVNFA